MKKIKLFDPIFNKEEEKSIIDVLNSHSWASGSGTGNVKKFEINFGNYIGSKSCVAVNSGTAALNLALSLIDIKNKEVILPSLSFVSTAHAIVVNGGKPIFVDVDSKTMCIDPQKIENALTKNTVAVLPVHFGGVPCDLKNIKKICKTNKLFLIEDAAHAAGSLYDGKKIGTHGDATCFSFHPVKNLAMPTGGLISLNFSNHKKMKKILNSRRWCGITNRNNSNYDVKELGWNYYMNEFSASIGLVQLKKLDKLNKIRQKIAKIYNSEIINIEKIPYSTNYSYHLYWILVKNRTKFRRNMEKMGIETGIHYKPIHTMTMYRSKLRLPITEDVGQKLVSIPIHPNLSELDIDRIVKSINKFS
jgi:perosamine synthetase